MSIDAMKQALEDICGARLCEVNSMSSRNEMLRLMDSAAAALRLAIEQAEKQEPVAWITEWNGKLSSGTVLDYKPHRRGPSAKHIPLYTAPPQRQPLTDEEIIEHFKARVDTGSLLSLADGVGFAERKHGIGGGE